MPTPNPDEKSKAGKTNVLFLFADDQRADTIAALGNPVIRTPNLDRLCRAGVAFNRAYMQGGFNGATCVPSRAMLLSGQSLFHVDEQLLRDETWPAAFGRAGYTTFMSGKWHNGPKSLPLCFQIARGVFAGGMTNPLKAQLSNLAGDRLTPPQPADKHACAVFADEAIRFLREHRGGPFCCYVPFDAPHDPHIVPDEFPVHYDPDKIPLPPNFLPQHPFDNGEMRIRDEVLLPHPRSPADVRRMIADYYRYISYLDMLIGRVLDSLEASPHAKNTIVVFAADSGVARGSHGLIGKQNLYEHSIRVPLIVAGPGIAAGKRTDAMCYLYDVLPTLGATCGVPAPPKSEGMNLTATLRNPDRAARPDLLFAYQNVQRAIETPQWKMIRYPKADQTQLFDLKNDPYEIHNLAAAPEHAAKAAELTALLNRELAAAGDNEPRRGGKRPTPKKREPQRISKAGATAPSGGRPNVVLIISDDQGWTDYGFMEHPQIRTPHLDKMAADGLVFPRGYVPSSLCCPSLASIITGLYPHQHKIACNDPPGNIGSNAWRAGRQQMDRDIEAVPTLPRVLSQHGYVSFQAGKWWLDNFARGGFTHGMTTGDPKKGGRHGDEGLDIGRKTMQPVFDFIRQAKGDGKPFFVWYAPMLPHQPHNPPERLLAHYRTQAPNEHVAKYWAMVEWFDETCGQLLDFLDQQNLASNTLLLYVADNGWVQGPAGGSVRSKLTPYDAGLRTPIILRWPQHVKPRRSDALAMSTDLCPTVLAALGIERPATLPGVNLLDESAVAARKTIQGECFLHTFENLDRPADNLLWRWIIDGDWKLIVPHRSAAAKAKPELYNLTVDPHEKANLAAQQPDRVEALRRKVDAWWQPD
jgi:uncharacterized sulfatase